MDPTRDIAWPPEDHPEWSAARPARTYYQVGSVRVTDRWLTVADQRYAIVELMDLRTARGPRPLAIGATAVAVCAVVAPDAGRPYLHTSIAWAGVALLVGLLLALAAALATGACRIRPRHFELWAVYRGTDVRLLLTPDERMYGAVTRALIRAREATPPDDLVGRVRHPTSA